MKKFLVFACAASLLSMTSCLKDGKEEITQAFPAFSVNIISSLEDETVLASLGAYTFDLNLMEQTGTVASDDKLIFDNTLLKFTSDSQTYQSAVNQIYFNNFKGTVTNTTLDLNNGFLMAIYPVSLTNDSNPEDLPGYYYSSANAGEYTYILSPNQNFNWEAVGLYYMGDKYRVNTFPVDTFFKGSTQTEYPNREGGMDTYQTEKITYRFALDEKLKTATMFMYNAKFSNVPQEPEKAVIMVEGLDVEYNFDGIVISGTNIIPQMYEAGAYTPVERFIVNNVEFRTTNEYYTNATIDFTVAGTYEGHFEGSYLKSTLIK